MIKRLLNSHPAVSATLATLANHPTSTRKPPPADLTSMEWEELSELRDVLSPFKQATKFISQEHTTTIALVMPLFNRLLNHHLQPSVEEDELESEMIEVLKERIEQDLRGRWKLVSDNMPEVIVMSIYLDPRFKDFSFVEDQRLRQSLLERAYRLSERLVINPDVSLSQQGEILPSPVQRNHSRLHSLFGEVAAASANSSSPSRFAEIESYHRRSACRFTVGERIVNPLSWWEQHESKFPRLVKQARRFLCITATSVPCERTFSKSGWIVNKRRTCLSNKNVSLLVFVSCNFHLLQNH